MWGKIISILMVVISVTPILTPIMVNGQEFYTEVREEILSSKEIKKKEQKISSNKKYAKNIAYGCEENSCDNATDIVKIDKETMEDIEYKIVADTHEIIVRIDLIKSLKDSPEEFKMIVTDGTNAKQVSENNIVNFKEIDSTNHIYEIRTGDLISKGFAQGGQYNISFSNGTDTVEIPADNNGTPTDLISMNVEVPLLLNYNGGTPLTPSDDITYSLIGDGINNDTDTDNVSDKEISKPSSVSSSTVTEDSAAAYGIYELESIGYEEANAEGSTSTSQANWSEETDLTLTKYDHIIRPLDGNYLMADNVDAYITQTSGESDNVGGFGVNTDANKDGYRPIGQIIGTVDGNDSVSFTGSISGDVDTIISDSRDNTYISNLYINEPTLSNIGMIGIGDDASINNLGMVDPSISGNDNVGSIAGQMLDKNTEIGEGSSLLNIYTLESEDVSSSVNYEVLGIGRNIGSIVGLAQETNISSNGLFDKGVEGIDNDLLIGQPSEVYPDKDGYKTFNTLDVQGKENVGGIVGNTTNVTINKTYNKGSLIGDNTVGGIVGVIKESTILNSYNASSGISTTTSGVGGIVGASMKNTGGANSVIKGVYNQGEILANGVENVGGIVGAGNELEISNAINMNNISGGIYVGGILGNTSDASICTIENTINTGNITADQVINSTDSSSSNYMTSNVGGIAGDLTPLSGSYLKNSLSTGDVSSTYSTTETLYGIGAVVGRGIGAGEWTSIIYNNYYLNGVSITPTDSTGAYTEVFPATEVNLNDVSWWKNTLFVDDNGANWNIDAADASNPTSDSDTTDESVDNADGTVNLGYYPTVKEVDESGNVTEYEVLEQGSMNLPKLLIKGLDYKINAMSLDTYVRVNFSSEEKAIQEGVIGIYNPGDTTSPIEEINIVIDSVVEDVMFDGSNLEADHSYDIIYKSIDGTDTQTVTIHTPNQEIIDGQVYAVIGDGENSKTDVNDMINSDVIEPGDGLDLSSGTKTTENYGIYELESIGYENANSKDTTSKAKADWSGTDLTLAKYDHIIRPIDGKYIIESNIEAEDTKIKTTADNVGGFGNDGYRPIGQMVGTLTGEESKEFTGELRGTNIVKVDATDTQENNIIKNLFIDESAIDNIGLISKSNGSKIVDLGIIQAEIIGQNNVGTLIGSGLGTEIINTYVYSDISIKGQDNVGGISGDLKEGSNVTSNDVFQGTIPGIDLTTDVQPSPNPDKDGYKTFSKVKINGSTNLGGIVGNSINSNIENTYNKGEIIGINKLGGIVGQSEETSIKNVYSLLSPEEKLSSQSGEVGGIVGYAINTKISNVWTDANIESIGSADILSEIGGVIGKIDGGSIENTYALGEIKTGQNSNVGGVVGTVADKETIITRTYNVMNINTDNNKVGGIIGQPSVGTKVYDSVYLGTITGTNTNIGGIVGEEVAGVILGNVYVSEFTDKSSFVDKSDYDMVILEEINNVNWWENELKFDKNWNIEAGDGLIPTDNADLVDESIDNDQGTVELNFLPKIEEKELFSGKKSGEEIPEQSEVSFIEPIYDLEIQKTVYDENITGGVDGQADISEVLNYTIKVTNTGNTAQSNIKVTDTISDVNLNKSTVGTFVESQGSATYTNPDITWDVGTLKKGDSATLTFKVTTNDSFTTATSISNTAVAISDKVVNKEAIATIPINSLNNLSITKAVDDENISGGVDGQADTSEVLDYTITVTNTGNTTQNNVVVSDVIGDANLDKSTVGTFVASQGSATYTNPNISWNIGTLKSGQSATLTFKVTTVSSFNTSTSIGNKASVGSDEIITPIDATVTIPMNKKSDLSITKTVDDVNISGGVDGQADVSEVLDYTITVKNTGNTTQSNVSVSDAISDVNLNKGTVGTFVASQGSVTYTSPNISWNIGTLNSGQSVTLTFKVTTNAGFTIAPNIANTASVSSDQVTTSKTATATIPIHHIYARTITKTVDDVNISGGVDRQADVSEVLNYTITLKNTGNTPQANAKVTDVISDSNLNKSTVGTFVASKGSATYANPNITWNVGTLDAGATETLTFKVTTNSSFNTAGSITNKASVVSDQDTTADEATATIPIHHVYTRTITKSVDDTNISGGTDAQADATEVLNYTIKVTNTGNTHQSDVKVTDTITDYNLNLDTVVVGAPSQGTASYTNPTINWNIGTLTTGSTATLTFKVTTKWTFNNNSSIVNKASVTSAQDTTADEATATIPIHRIDSVSITKTVDDVNISGGVNGKADASETLNYTITVKNTGNTTHYGTVITDTITDASLNPAEVTVGTPGKGTATYTNPTVTWNYGALYAGDNKSLTVSVKTDATFATTATSIANTASMNSDRLSSPKTATVTIPIVTYSDSIDYKIDAIGLDMWVKVNVREPTRGQLEKVKVDICATGSTTPLITNTQTVTSGTSLIFNMANNSTDKTKQLQPNTNYDIVIYQNGKKTRTETIHTPKVETTDGDITTENDNYAVIGDGQNYKTDVNDHFGSDQVNPTTTSSKFGIYELESIGYEDVLGNVDDWGGNDLTLRKYDHIVRPINGKYKIASNIDATRSSSWNGADNIGGFGSNGYNPIGKRVTLVDDSPLEFTGVLTGANISNLYINEADNYTGVVAKNKGTIQYLNVENCNINGTGYVGTIAGSNSGTVAGSDSNKVYTSGTVKGSANYVGGILGHNYTGVTSYAETGASISSTASYVGGAIGIVNNSGHVSNVKSTGSGTVQGRDYVGGLFGSVEGSSYFDTGSASLSTGAVTGNNYVGGAIGRINTSNADYIKFNVSRNVTSNGGGTGGIIGIVEKPNDSSGSAGQDLYDSSYSGTVKCNGTGATAYVGGLIGQNGASDTAKWGYDISRATNSGTIDADQGSSINAAGGITGWNEEYLDSNTNSMRIYSTAANGTGGIVGYMYKVGSTNNNKNNAIVNTNTTNTKNVGGIVGYNNTAYSKGNSNTAQIFGIQNAGGIVGYNVSSKLENNTNSGIISDETLNNKDTNINQGGIVGDNNKGSVVNGKNSGAVYGTNNVGGIVGIDIGTGSSNVTVDNSSNTGLVNGENGKYTGGISGQIKEGKIQNSSNSGEVIGQGSKYTGGIVGQLYNSSAYKVHNNSTGAVSGVDVVGGIVGETYGASSVKGASSTNFSDYTTNAAKITGSGASLGGIVGRSYNSTGDKQYIQYVANTGVISSTYSTLSYDKSTMTYEEIVAINQPKTKETRTTYSRVGGVLGDAYQKTANDKVYIDYSYNTASVTGQRGVGGILGYCSGQGEVNISVTYNAGKITATKTGISDSHAGGIVSTMNMASSSNEYNLIVRDAYNTGWIISKGENAGGIVAAGSVGRTGHMSIYDVYNRGPVETYYDNNSGSFSNDPAYGGVLGYNYQTSNRKDSFNRTINTRHVYGHDNSADGSTAAGTNIGLDIYYVYQSDLYQNYFYSAVKNCYDGDGDSSKLTCTSHHNSSENAGTNTVPTNKRPVSKTGSQLRNTSFWNDMFYRDQYWSVSSTNYPKLKDGNSRIIPGQSTYGLPSSANLSKEQMENIDEVEVEPVNVSENQKKQDNQNDIISQSNDIQDEQPNSEYYETEEESKTISSDEQDESNEEYNSVLDQTTN